MTDKEKKEIKERNKLIADFVEQKKFKVFVTEDHHGKEIYQEWKMSPPYLFSVSYDWLMPVVNNIINLTPIIDYKGSVWTWIQKTGLVKRELLQAVKKNDISILFASVAEFIEWYNENNK